MNGRQFHEDEMTHAMLHAAAQQSGSPLTAIPAFVASYDPSQHAVRCIIAPWVNAGYSQSQMTGWVPLMTPWMGNGWGMQIAPFGGATQDNPAQGEQIMLLVVNASNGSYIAGGYLYSSRSSPPNTALGAGEAVLQHETGSKLYFQSDGSVLVNAAANLTATAAGNITATAGGNATVTANGGDATVTASGNVSATAGGTAEVTAPSIKLGASGQTLQELVTAAAVAVYNGHTHNYSGGTTSGPNQTLGSGDLTSTVTAG